MYTAKQGHPLGLEDGTTKFSAASVSNITKAAEEERAREGGHSGRPPGRPGPNQRSAGTTALPVRPSGWTRLSGSVGGGPDCRSESRE